MGYRIEAYLDDGRPALTIKDAETERVALHWRADKDRVATQQWQQLFRQLILLTCKQDLNVRVFKLK